MFPAKVLYYIYLHKLWLPITSRSQNIHDSLVFCADAAIKDGKIVQGMLPAVYQQKCLNALCAVSYIHQGLLKGTGMLDVQMQPSRVGKLYVN